ncbi:hypothetical protein SAMN02745146_0562 [Hymenobacter daecheongensis DSM 21074]|uniref:Uncharacterized protein n=1 Tax=Hymenobacter daecheongensis DSM 21074 TaxID=1121955 RepID=A0A1M6AA50_9BACT|nr:DUF6766 family protein [Hymenobacter daecheongensis]SHI33340.1 hypothetical protein SAMN02745146_0562 [Hymenobacter daecheongensis DSM 21074]
MSKKPSASPLRRFLYENGLLLVGTGLMLITLVGQGLTGWHEYNSELEDMGLLPLTLGRYLTSGHFVEATFENWESEFLQMGLYVLLTIWLRQKGSSESKKLYEDEEVDRTPDPNKPHAPAPVKRGGWVLTLYQNSLSLAFLVLFLGAAWLHAAGGRAVYNIEQQQAGKPQISTVAYMETARFWFESFQNWQSEMLSIVSIVGLSIFLRQKGSPESKPVDASHAETGE